MVILALQNPWLSLGVQLAQAGDIDVQAIANIDPAGVDDVLPVTGGPMNDPGIDVEEVGVRDVLSRQRRRRSIVMYRAVEVVAHVTQGRFRDLRVNVPIPR